MIGAIILGLIAGAVARLLIPGDIFEGVGGLLSWVLTLIVGLVGAWLGWWIFTGVLGIGDTDMFDLGGIIGAVIGAVVLLLILTALTGGRRRRA